MILIILNCLLLTFLFIAAIIGLKAKNLKKTKNWLVIRRIIYLSLLVGRVLISYHLTNLAPLPVSIKLLLVILLIILIELFFAKKQSQAINWQTFVILSGAFITTLLINIFV